MSARKLRWLGPIGFLGLLALPVIPEPVRQPWLGPLMAFMVFLAFFRVRVDERSEANLGRAAAFAYLVTLVSFVACFVWLSVVLERGAGGSRAVDMFLWSVAVVFSLHISTFVLSYIYFDHKGV